MDFYKLIELVANNDVQGTKDFLYYNRGINVNVQLEQGAWLLKEKTRPLIEIAFSKYTSENVEMIKLLLEHGADPNLIKYDMVQEAIRNRKGHPLVKALMLSDKFDSHRQNPEIKGHDLFSEAAMWNAFEIVSLMLEMGANPQNPLYTEDRVRLPMLYWPGVFGSPNVFALILKHRQFDLNLIDDAGNTLLHNMTKNGQSYESIKHLLSHGGINVNTANDLGMTPLHYAAKRELTETVGLLLEYGADPNCFNNDGQTPLMLSAAQSDYRAVNYLIQAGADPTETDKNHKTAISMIPGYDAFMTFMALKDRHFPIDPKE